MRGEFDHLIGKPFGEYGRGPDCYDCWGIVIESGKIMGEQTPDYSDVSHNERKKIWKEVAKLLPVYEEVDKPVKGAISLFKTIEGEAHFGRVIDERYFIQSTRGLGVHISSITGLYSRLVKGFYLCKK